jgi:hypothetical protein
MATNEQGIIDAINRAKSGKDNLKKTQPATTDSGDSVPVQVFSSSIKGSDSAAEEDKPSQSLDRAIQAITPQISFEDNGNISLSKDMLQKMFDKKAADVTKDISERLAKVEDQNQSLVEQITKERDAKEQLKQEYEAKLKKAVDEKNLIASVVNDFGYSPVPGLDLRSPSSTAVTGPYIATAAKQALDGDAAFREFQRISDGVKKSGIHVTDHATGKVSLQVDNRPLVKFVKKNRDALRDGMECYAKKHGFLRGSGGSGAGIDAPTTLADVPPLFLDYLSESMRLEHTPAHVLWQFSNRRIQTGIPPGQTILVPRIPHVQGGTVAADWTLTPGTPTNIASQPLTSTAESVVILENGMGKTVSNPAVAIPEFITAYSLVDLEMVLRRRIAYNYAQWEDLAHQELWFTTTNVVYSSGGGVVSTAAQVTSGGQMTVPFLGQLYAYLASQNIPTYEDGCYGIACPPNHVGQLQSDTYSHHQYISKENVESVTNMFVNATQNNEINRISGYVGKIAGFHIFQGSSFSTGAVGTTGVAQEAVGGGASKVMRSGFAFGPDSIGWATSMPMMLRRDNNDDFGRLNRYIWLSHEGYGALDIDPARAGGSGNEQLRVVEIRLADSPV